MITKMTEAIIQTLRAKDMKLIPITIDSHQEIEQFLQNRSGIGFARPLE